MKGEKQKLYLLQTRGEVNAGLPTPDIHDPSTEAENAFRLG